MDKEDSGTDSDEMSSLLMERYHDPSKVGAYRGATQLWRSLQSHPNNPDLDTVKEWLRGREEYTLHKSVPKNVSTLQFMVPHAHHTIQADLMDVSSISSINDGVKFLLTTVDVFTGEATVVPLRSKRGPDVALALTPILEKGYLFLHTDKGTEFFNSNVRSVTSRLGVQHYSTENDNIKAGMVERFNRTLREVLARLMNHRRTKKYVDVLDDLVEAHNKTPHSRTGVAPSDTPSIDTHHRWIEKYERDTPKPINPVFKVGDHVRLAAARRTFMRGYHEQWTREVFVVSDVDTSSSPITYRVKDLLGESVKGRFYASELQLITYDADAPFQVEKIIRTRKRQGKTEMFVKWLGYPEKFNSWIDGLSLS